MAPVKEYKKAENRVVSRFFRRIKAVISYLGSWVGRFFRFGRQRLTVMLIPHSESRVYNLQISFFALVFAGVFTAALLGGVVFFATGLGGASRQLSQRERELIRSRSSLESLREEVNEVVKSASVFQETLDSTVSLLGLEEKAEESSSSRQGDISSFSEVEEVGAEALQEVSELQNLQRYFDQAVRPLEEIGGVLGGQKELLADIPTLWPLKGVRGYVTNPFGPAENPWTSQLYLHRGVDIAYYRLGVPLVATANGKVVEVDYKPLGYGNYVLIKHKYGFYSLYAHMNHASVKEGQAVSRGDVIGIMGSTGNSTGRHVHLEVRIGSQLVDPMKYMNISSSIVDDRS